MCLPRQPLRQRTVTQNLHLVVRRYESGRNQRLEIDGREFLLRSQLIERRKVDGLVLHTLQVRETELRQTALQRHLTALETELRLVARTRLSTLVTAARIADATRTGTAADTLVVVCSAFCGFEIM